MMLFVQVIAELKIVNGDFGLSQSLYGVFIFSNYSNARTRPGDW